MLRLASMDAAGARRGGCEHEDGASSAVAFAVVAETAWKDEVRMVGGPAALGAWQPDHGLCMGTCDRTVPVWTAVFDPKKEQSLTGADFIEYKFVIMTSNGWSLWENGPNRRLDVRPGGSRGGWIVARFGDQAEPGPPRPLPSQLTAPGCIVLFEALCPSAKPGDEVFAVGAATSMGAWSPEKGVALKTSQAAFPKWSGSMRLGPSVQLSMAWKLAIRRADGECEWEPGQNRLLAFRRVGPALKVCDARATFGDGCGEGASEPSASCCLGLPCGASQGAEAEAEELAPAAPGDHALPRQYSSLSTCSTGLGTQDDSESSMGLASPRLDMEPGEGTPQEAERSGPWLWAGAHRLGKSGADCEDAYFVGPTALGVADGVGSMAQFARFGVDVAAYATELMELAARALMPGGAASLEPSADAPDLRAERAIVAAEQEATQFGASTIIVLELMGASVGIANLGDSGFMVLRRGPGGFEVVARSTEQQHTWNFPYQIMRLPPSLTARLAPGTKLDAATDCDRYHLPVRAGDLVLLFTDGLSDNLHEHEILEVVDRLSTGPGSPPRASGLAPSTGRGPVNPEYLAQEIARAARARSVDAEADSPFSVAARQHGQEYTGGKEDDITVAAAWVVAEA